MMGEMSLDDWMRRVRRRVIRMKLTEWGGKYDSKGKVTNIEIFVIFKQEDGGGSERVKTDEEGVLQGD